MVVDVFRATTVLCTAAALGRPCLVAADVTEARALTAATPAALLAGEQGGRPPEGFDLGNSPAEIALRPDVHRPMVLVTSSGTPLLCRATAAGAPFAACLRNVTAQAEHLLGLDLDVAVLPAGTRGRPRIEDDLAAARVAALLLDAGFLADATTREHVATWAARPVAACLDGASAAFLRRTGHEDDLEFVLGHLDDLPEVFPVSGRRVGRCAVGASAA